MRHSPLDSIFCTILCLLFINHASGQPVLSKADAVRLAVEQNYDLRIASNNVKIAQNLTDKKSLGYRPVLDFSAGPSLDIGGSNQTFSSGQENSTSNALSWGVNGSVAGSYTLLDHTRTIALQQSLESRDLSIVQLRQNVERITLDVLRQYYAVARAYTNVELQRETIDLSRRRLERARLQFEFGQTNSLDVLNAQVDIQRDSINLLTIRQDLANAQRDLNVLIGRGVDLSFDVDTAVRFQQGLSLQDLNLSASQLHVDLALIDQESTTGALGSGNDRCRTHAYAQVISVLWIQFQRQSARSIYHFIKFAWSRCRTDTWVEYF